MVEKDLIEKLGKVCASLEEAKGDVRLFALLKMDELTDKWTVVVAADWVTHTSFEDAFSFLRGLLLDELKEGINTIARIGIFRPDDHLAELMTKLYKTGDILKEDQQINGNLIHEGAVIKATNSE